MRWGYPIYKVIEFTHFCNIHPVGHMGVFFVHLPHLPIAFSQGLSLPFFCWGDSRNVPRAPLDSLVIHHNPCGNLHFHVVENVPSPVFGEMGERLQNRNKITRMLFNYAKKLSNEDGYRTVEVHCLYRSLDCSRRAVEPANPFWGKRRPGRSTSSNFLNICKDVMEGKDGTPLSPRERRGINRKYRGR